MINVSSFWETLDLKNDIIARIKSESKIWKDSDSYMILTRDALQHIPYKRCIHFFHVVKNSSAKLFLTSSQESLTSNDRMSREDVSISRSTNFEITPFNFPIGSFRFIEAAHRLVYTVAWKPQDIPSEYNETWLQATIT